MGQPLGFDSFDPFTQLKFDKASSLGPPLFWGRYFHAPGQIDSRGKKERNHYSSAENQVLRRNACRLLPIARQTGRVGGTNADGAQHAAVNVAAIFEAVPPSYLYGADPDVLVFLDIQPQPQLSTEYYIGWSTTLQSQSQQISGGTVRFHPAAYLNSKSNGPSIKAINAAIAAGAQCAGLWVARYRKNESCSVVPDWSASEPFLTPTVPTNVPILAWQCHSEEDNSCPGFDVNLINEGHSDIFLNRLVLTPAS
jgi:hypothetical protein